jgi:hypothetical protein
LRPAAAYCGLPKPCSLLLLLLLPLPFACSLPLFVCKLLLLLS